MKFLVELTQLIGAIVMIIGAWVINWGFGILVLGALVTAIGTLVERSLDGSRQPNAEEK